MKEGTQRSECHVASSQRVTAIATAKPPHRGLAHPWQGHRPAVQAALEALIEFASAGRGDASIAGRTLFTVCEFRAAIANRILGPYLSQGAVEKLTAARLAFDVIGATGVADRLSITIDGLREAPSGSATSKLVGKLQADLLKSGETLDELIERFAIRRAVS